MKKIQVQVQASKINTKLRTKLRKSIIPVKVIKLTTILTQIKTILESSKKVQGLKIKSKLKRNIKKIPRSKEEKLNSKKKKIN